MNADSRHVSVETVSPQTSHSLMLKGRRLSVVRAVCVALGLLAIALFVAGLPAFYDDFRTLSVFDEATRNEIRANLVHLGLSVDFYAGYYVGLSIAFAATCIALAIVIYRHSSEEPIALFVGLALVLLGTTFSGSNEAVGVMHPILTWTTDLLDMLSIAAVFIFFYLFPDGRFIPRWTRPAAALLVAWAVMGSLFSSSFIDSEAWPEMLYMSVMLGCLCTGLVAQVYRYRYVSSPMERQQAKWVVFGFAVALGGFLGLISIDALAQELQPGTLADFVIAAAIYGLMLLIPLSIGMAILRYRLWDINLVINRTLVYGTLTASVAGIYVLVVGGLGTLMQSRDNLVVSLLAAGLVAVLFAPLRDRLQRGVNRLMYGERDEPYKVLSGLGERIESAPEPDAVLPNIAQTVAQALRLPHVAIRLKQNGEGLIEAARYGNKPAAEPLVLPLAYREEEVGEFVLSPRAGSEGFSRSEVELLEALARQIGIAAHAVRLSEDLQRSRERLVVAREEERRRLRRDLHDGVGPRLAALTLKLETARNKLSRDPEAAALIGELSEQVRETIADVRRSVYALRPPSLDELGLVSAMREGAAQYEHNGLRVSVEAPEELPSLPAAVEVACYHIASGAMTNVVRHAGASNCTVRIRLEEAGVLGVEIEDDGRGIGEDVKGGVGLHSMRERAEELGGSCIIEPRPRGGTRVVAELPCRLELTKQTNDDNRPEEEA